MLLSFAFFTKAQNLTTRFELSKGTQSPPYKEIIEWWNKMDAASPIVKMNTMGMTDAGFPLNLVIVSNDKDWNFDNIHRKNKRVILINNGIHPGEPDGIDASMLLVRDIADKKISLPDNVVLAIIPVYNIGGCLNRSGDFRVDQNGPDEFGFRGNSQNLDLNRDFIKSDSKEARSFAEIFHLTDPDVFVDNHVSDGADYQHIMTLVTSQHNKLGGDMGEFMNKVFEPGIFSLMKEKGYDMVPYVNAFGDTPETGWTEFWDSPRYSSGYASLWQTFSFIPETHMLKTYEQRVRSTYALMKSFIEFTSVNSEKIKTLRAETREKNKTAANFPIAWGLDRNAFSMIEYKGYESGHKISEVSGQPRLFYDRTKPFNKQVKFYNTYQVRNTIEKPVAYIIPQGWWKVIDLLKLNGVVMRRFLKDSFIAVEVYHIDDYKSSAKQYEGHHPNSDVKIHVTARKMNFRKGDVYIPMNQAANRFIMEMLEPQGEDSYFAWNFFDPVLGQKEGYSSYAFEDIAADYLVKHPDIKARLDQRRSTDTAFAKNGAEQLYFVYQNSPFIEPAYMEYPVYRVR
jgi:hypothetical protein